MKVFITRPIPKIGVAALRKSGHKVTMQSEPIDLSYRELCRQAKGADAVLSFLSNRIDAGFFKAVGPQLKVVSNYAVGYDNIDVVGAHALGVRVGNTPCPEVSRSVAEHAFALMISAVRRIAEADRFVKAGKYTGWDPDLLIGTDLYDTTLGIVGLGAIGREVAHRAVTGFGMKVLYTDIAPNIAFEKEFNATYLPLEKLLAGADIVTLHVPLLPSTRHLINPKTLRQMKKGAILINTARGLVVDQSAVLKALESGRLGGFGLDVFECEPAIACNAVDKRKMARNERVIMTPHIASATVRARDAMAVMAAQNIIAGFSGGVMPSEVQGV